DAAADYIFTGKNKINFFLPGTLKVIIDGEAYKNLLKENDPFIAQYVPIMDVSEVDDEFFIEQKLRFISMDVCCDAAKKFLSDKQNYSNVVLVLWSSGKPAMPLVRSFITQLMNAALNYPVVLKVKASENSVDEQLIHFAVEAGALFLDGMGDGIWLENHPNRLIDSQSKGRTYLPVKNNQQYLNNTSFSILQATRTRISKTEYISWPSCGRTLFDLQETTAKIRKATHHLKGVKIAIMGCIVNGPGEMADADFGYVGSGPGKITLYKGKEVVKRNVPSEIAVDELILLLKENGAWVEPQAV